MKEKIKSQKNVLYDDAFFIEHMSNGMTIDLEEHAKNKEQMAVMWFANKISHGGLVSKKQFNELIEQAKKIEKEHIIKFLKLLRHHIEMGGNSENIEEWFDYYYNKSFKQQEQ
jgi:hypothetical protein